MKCAASSPHANVFLSFLSSETRRSNEAALTLLNAPEENKIAGLIQSFIFEIVYVLQSQ